MVFPLGDVERSRITPVGTYLLMAVNVLMYVVQLVRGEQFTTAYAATPYEITHGVDIDRALVIVPPPPSVLKVVDGTADEPETVIPQGPVIFPIWLTLLSAMFLHGGPMHLAGNMLYLWIFGDNVEETLGTPRYILLYLTCGLAASLAQIAANPESVIPTLGASGAIAGLMGMYIVWFPHNQIRALLPFPLLAIVHIPAVWFIGVWIAMQVFLGFGSLERLGVAGGVAYLAHFGGAACGVLAGFLFRDSARAHRPPGQDPDDDSVFWRRPPARGGW